MTEHYICVLKQASVDKLRAGIKDNIEMYESPTPDFAKIFGGEDYARTTSIKVCGDDLRGCFGAENYDTQDKDAIRLKDPFRCEAIYAALKNLTPQQATDERLWTYLTHFVFWDYARARWPLSSKKKEEDKIQHIKSHYFMGGLRGMVRDNAISRLWWMAHVCDRAKKFSLADSLGALLLQEDVRKEIMERATFCRSAPIFNSLMKFMMLSFKNIPNPKTHESSLHQRENFRKLCKQLNRVGGVRVLDSLEQSKLDDLIGEIIRQIGLNPAFKLPAGGQ